jgi:SpoVK/Ycf46/Vps4 family AAA+-type ATPase
VFLELGVCVVRSKLLIKLIESHVREDEEAFRATVLEIIEEEKSKGNGLVANRLRKASKGLATYHLSSLKSLPSEEIPAAENGLQLLEIRKPMETFDDVVLSPELKDSFYSVIKEMRNREKLRSWGISTPSRILFCGPPGTGKTLSAHILANELGYDLFYVRLDSLISSYLGQTGNNLRRIFDFSREKRAILFLDEFDAIAKMRDDTNELGEIKRIVNSLVQNIDAFSSEGLLLAATNHPQLLDVAIWRRFDEVFWFDLPSRNERVRIFQVHTRTMPLDDLDFDTLAEKTKDFSGSDIEKTVRLAARNAVTEDRSFISIENFLSCIETVKYKKIKQKIAAKERDGFTPTKLKTEELRRKSIELRKGGLSLEEIGERIGKSATTVHRYIKEG